MRMHDELVSLYGDGKVDEVESSACLNDLRRRYRDVEGFATEQNHVRQLRSTLQDLLADQRSSTQVKLCLKLLYQTKQDDKRVDYHRLIKLAYWPNWSPDQQKHFDEAYVVIAGGVYYFLSFTIHNMTPGNVNIVNRNHRHLIEDVFFNRERQEIGDYTKENLLAKVVWYFLESQGLKGFYYPLHEGDSDSVRKKLLTNLEATPAFVQVVHAAVFEKDPDENYCFIEYESVRKSPIGAKRFFILAQSRDELTAARLPHHAFEPWRAEVIHIDALQLKYSEYYDDTVLRHNTKEIREKIVERIENARLHMFENVLQ